MNWWKHHLIFMYLISHELMNSWIHEFMNSRKHESCRHNCLVVKLISLSRFLKVWRHTWFPNLQCNLLMLQNGVISHHYLNFASPDLHAPWWVMNSWIREFMNSWIHEFMKAWKYTFILPIKLNVTLPQHQLLTNSQKRNTSRIQ